MSCTRYVVQSLSVLSHKPCLLRHDASQSADDDRFHGEENYQAARRGSAAPPRYSNGSRSINEACLSHLGSVAESLPAVWGSAAAC